MTNKELVKNEGCNTCKHFCDNKDMNAYFYCPKFEKITSYEHLRDVPDFFKDIFK